MRASMGVCEVTCLSTGLFAARQLNALLERSNGLPETGAGEMSL